jgi:D-lactate dehydrogenase (cytochrome)
VQLQRAIEALTAQLGDRLSTSDSVRDIHGRDESSFPPAPPDAVAFPRSTEEVAAIVRTCAEHGVPVVAFGTGSSLEGHVLAVNGGIALDTSLMDAILRVSIEDLDVTVQPGVTRTALEKRVAAKVLPDRRGPEALR